MQNLNNSNHRVEYTPKGRIRFEYEASGQKLSMSKNSSKCRGKCLNLPLQQQNDYNEQSFILQQKFCRDDQDNIQNTQEVKQGINLQQQQQFDPIQIFHQIKNLEIQNQNLKTENKQHLHIIYQLNQKLKSQQQKHNKFLKINKKQQKQLKTLYAEKSESETIMIRLHEQIEINDKNKAQKIEQLEKLIKNMQAEISCRENFEKKQKNFEKIQQEKQEIQKMIKQVQRYQLQTNIQISRLGGEGDFDGGLVAILKEKFQKQVISQQQKFLKSFRLKVQQKMTVMKNRFDEVQNKLEMMTKNLRQKNLAKSSLIFEFKVKDSKKVIKIKRSRSVQNSKSRQKKRVKNDPICKENIENKISSLLKQLEQKSINCKKSKFQHLRKTQESSQFEKENIQANSNSIKKENLKINRSFIFEN